jgi:hypothetical protein
LRSRLLRLALALVLLVPALGCRREKLDASGRPITIGRYKIRTFPAGARVWVNGELKLDLTPGTLTLPAGEYELRLQVTGAEPRLETITVEGGETKELDVRLPEPPPSRLTVRSDVEGAEVRINGYKRGVTPLVGAVVKPGAIDVTVTAGSEARAARTSLAIGEAKTLEIFFGEVTSRPEEPEPPPPPMSLPPPRTTVTIGLQPNGFVSTVDGVRLGETPLFAHELEPGRHELILTSKDGRLQKQVSIDLEAGKAATYRFMLRDADQVPGWRPDAGAPDASPGDASAQGASRP